MHEHKQTSTRDDDLIITESNFSDYFKEVHKYKPQPGEVMARYAAVASFIDGQLKRDVLDLLTRLDNGAYSAIRVLQKMAGATERTSYQVAREMCEDLLNMTIEEVAQKEYSYHAEFFWYTQKQYIPTDDPHWTCVQIKNLNEFLDKEDEFIKTRIVDHI